MATESKPKTQETLDSWFHKLHAVSRSATEAQKQSSDQSQRGRMVRIEADINAKYDQLDTNNRLSERILTVRKLRDRLSDLKIELEKSILRLSDSKMITENFMVKVSEAQTINVECLTHRDKRRGKEYVSDPVQDELLAEQRLLSEVQGNLQNDIEEAFRQLCIMQDAHTSFHEDIMNKETAIEIDIEQYNMNEKSAQIGFKPYATRKPEW
ncbi:unnamed protein product [Protopolystoma xenopodis]|uniref:Tektin n=1 Tax=Protopolystoma xenopodis TaxID=117903 RepID=A0A3S5ADK8_9PLAT|nr:unnamed protein product [Protopolystoma xenopodis]